MLRRALLQAAALAALMAGSAAQAEEAPKSYPIGAVLAMSGQANWYGQVMSQGIKQAVDEINAKGGIDGVPLEIFIEDHKGGGGQEGVAAMNRLLSLHHVKAVLTSFSAPTLGIAPIADQEKILLVNGGGVSNSLVGLSKYLFHIRSLASDLGRAAITEAHDMNLKKLAQLHWKNDAGDSIVRAVVPAWEKMGGKIVATEAVPQGTTNMDTQMAKVRAANPDVIGVWMFTPESGLALKRIREFGMKQPVIGVEFTANDAKVAGDNAEGYLYANDYFAPSDDNPWSKQFAEGYKKRYGADPEFYAANYYEGTYLIAELIRRAKAKGGDYWNGEALRQALLSNPKFDSVYGGQMVFQKNGVALKRTALFTVEDGKKKFVKLMDVTP
jgi:branched-chain amino acid transport system substrate-binding protein